ncbi:G-protein coupled receptor [Schistosoma japonicum]|nr:G-protein coupled receptor [Schistosoma japonicum]
MTDDVCRYTKPFLTKNYDFILTNNQLSETNSNTLNNLLYQYDNSSFVYLNEYIENLTNKLKQLQSFKQQSYICNVNNILWMYIPPIIFILGSLGNILSFIILQHPSTGSMTLFLYLIARSIVDEIVLIIGLLRRWIDKIFNTKFENTSIFLCKMIHFLGTSSSFLSVWLTVILTAERALVVSFPLHVTRLINYSKVKNIIILMSLLCIVLSLHFFFTVDIITNCSHELSNSSLEIKTNFLLHHNLTNTFYMKCFNQCTILPKYSLINWYWSTFDAIFYSYLPFCLIFGFNIIILKSVYYANRNRNHLHESNCTLNNIKLHQTTSITSLSLITIKKQKHNNESYTNVKQLTIMLLIISFSFLFTTVSIVLIKILAQILDLRGTHKMNARMYFRLADTIAELFMYINHAMNFYLFCATGKTFRKRLMLLINRCRFYHLHRNEINIKHNYQLLCCSTISCNSCLSIYFTSSFCNTNDNTNNSNKLFKKHKTNQNVIVNKLYCEEATVSMNPPETNIYDAIQVSEISDSHVKNTILETVTSKLNTPSFINNLHNIFLHNNNKFYRSLISLNRNSFHMKSINNINENNHHQLSPRLMDVSKINKLSYNQHNFNKNELNIGKYEHLDVHLYDVMQHLKFKLHKQQTSTESLQTV